MVKHVSECKWVAHIIWWVYCKSFDARSNDIQSEPYYYIIFKIDSEDRIKNHHRQRLILSINWSYEMRVIFVFSCVFGKMENICHAYTFTIGNYLKTILQWCACCFLVQRWPNVHGFATKIIYVQNVIVHVNIKILSPSRDK